MCNYIFFDIPDPKNLSNKKKDHPSCVIRTRDTKGHAHGHVTLTYKVTRDSWCVELYIFDISDPKNLQNKNKDHRSCVIRTRDTRGHAHGHVTLTYKVTRDSWYVELYIFDIPDPKNLHNKKNDHRSCVIRTRDTKGHAHGHVTLTYKVTRDS